MAKYEFLARSLEPARQYAVQVRTVSGQNKGPWSKKFVFTTIEDKVPPKAPSDLTWQVSGAAFESTWTAPTLNEIVEGEVGSGEVVQDLKDYKVTVYPTGSPNNSKSYFTASENFEFTYSMNVAAFGTPQPEVTIEVRSRDMAGNLSSVPAVDTADNGPPGDFTLDAVGERKAISLTWTKPADYGTNTGDETQAGDDFKEYELWRNGSHYVTVSGDTYAYNDGDPGRGDHSYFIRARDLFEQTNDSNIDTATASGYWEDDIVAPAKPDNVTFATDIDTNDASGATAYVEVTWDAPTTNDDDDPNTTEDESTPYEDHEGFRVRWSRAASGPYNYATLVDDRADPSIAEQFSFRIDDLKSGHDYYIAVQAFDRYGNNSKWATDADGKVTTKDDITPPATPTGLVLNGGLRNVNASWDANTEADLSHYELHASTTSGFTPDDTNLKFKGNGTSASWFAEDNETWYAVITAVDRAGNPDPRVYSAEATTTTLAAETADVTPPSDVSGLTATPSTYYHGSTEHGKADLAWTAATDNEGISEYVISFKLSTDTAWNEIITGGAETQYTVTSLDPGNTYNFRLKAVDFYGNRSVNWSSTVSATIETSGDDPPQAVTMNNPTIEPGNILWSWSDNSESDVNDYKLEIATDDTFSSNLKTYYVDGTSYSFIGVEGTTYYARVYVRDIYGNESPASNVKSAKLTKGQVSNMGLGVLTRRISMVADTIYYAFAEDDSFVSVNSEIVATGNAGGQGTVAVSAGDVIETNKPTGISGSGLLPPIPISWAGNKFWFESKRYMPSTVKIYAPYESAQVTYTSDEGQTVNGAAQPVTIDVPAGTLVSINLGDSVVGGHYFESDRPVVMGKAGNGGDYIILSPASIESLIWSITNSHVFDGGTLSTVGEYAYSDQPHVRYRYADGAGGDMEQHMPIEGTGDHYVIPHSITGYVIATVFPCTIKAWYWDSANSEWLLYNTHDATGASKSNPVAFNVGDSAGSGAALNSSNAWLFVADGRFYIRTNDPDQDEYTVIGWRSDLRQSYENPESRIGLWTDGNDYTLIDGGYIQTNTLDAATVKANTAFVNDLNIENTMTVDATGQITSANYSNTSGSEAGYKLNSSTFEFYGGSLILGGSTGLNINNVTDHLWFGATTFEGALWRVDGLGDMRVGGADKFYVDGTTGDIWSGNGSKGAAPWAIDGDGSARFSDVVLTGTDLANGTDFLNAGGSFVLHKHADGIFEVHLAGDFSIDAGGDLILNGGNINLTSGNIFLNGGDFNMSSGTFAMNGGTSTWAGTNFTMSDGVFKLIGGSITGRNAADTETHYVLDNTGLTIHKGLVEAPALAIHNSPNLIDAAYADFEYKDEWYQTYTHTDFDTMTTSSEFVRYRGQSMKLVNTAGATRQFFLSQDLLTYNINIDPDTTYIFSAWVYNNTGSATTVALRVRHDSDDSHSTAASESVASGQWTRISGTFTTKVLDAAIIPFLETYASSTIFIDGLQIEEKIGSSTEPSFFKVGGLTTIDGGNLSTGTIDANKVSIIGTGNAGRVEIDGTGIYLYNNVTPGLGTATASLDTDLGYPKLDIDDIRLGYDAFPLAADVWHGLNLDTTDANADNVFMYNSANNRKLFRVGNKSTGGHFLDVDTSTGLVEIQGKVHIDDDEVHNQSNHASTATITGTSNNSIVSDGAKSIGSPYASFGTGSQGSGTSEDNYVQFDFGEVKEVSSFYAYWWAGNNRHYWYKIKYSLDGTNWFYAVGRPGGSGWIRSTRRSSSSGEHPTVDRFWPRISARYVRLIGDGNTSNAGNHVYEVEIMAQDADGMLTVGENFRVDNGGNLWASNGNFTGTINATGGTISGQLNVTNKLVAGTVEIGKDVGGGSGWDGISLQNSYNNVFMHNGSTTYFRLGYNQSSRVYWHGSSFNIEGGALNVIGGTITGATFTTGGAPRVVMSSSSLTGMVRFYNSDNSERGRVGVRPTWNNGELLINSRNWALFRDFGNNALAIDCGRVVATTSEFHYFNGTVDFDDNIKIGGQVLTDIVCAGGKINIAEYAGVGRIFGPGNLSFVQFQRASTTDRLWLDANDEIRLGGHDWTPRLYSSSVYNHTTSGGANVHIASSQIIYRSTSSLRYKPGWEYRTDLADIELPTPITWEGQEGTEDEGRTFVGFGAEHIAEVLPEGAAYDENDEPMNIETNAVVAVLAAKVKALEEKINSITQ